ncbi:hypothetical protein NLI96_g3412 [Meripilus lineatus]|uniref:Uncharacterized protein n=1 Tax=Meripilus lineatus TaxID=2056292 RepID=A0AAD5V6V7_9APHY|nr:hypothetical protein NLI96_g3412 [Physisporinus lineatus]
MPSAKTSTTKKSTRAKAASAKQAKAAAAAPQEGTEAPPSQIRSNKKKATSDTPKDDNGAAPNRVTVPKATTRTSKPRGLTPPLQTRSNRKKAASDTPKDDNEAAPNQLTVSKATTGTSKQRQSTRKTSSGTRKAAPSEAEKNAEPLPTEESAGQVPKGNTCNSSEPSAVGHEPASGDAESGLQDKPATSKVPRPRPTRREGTAPSNAEYEPITAERQRQVFRGPQRAENESRIEDEDEVQGMIAGDTTTQTDVVSTPPNRINTSVTHSPVVAPSNLRPAVEAPAPSPAVPAHPAIEAPPPTPSIPASPLVPTSAPIAKPAPSQSKKGKERAVELFDDDDDLAGDDQDDYEIDGIGFDQNLDGDEDDDDDEDQEQDAGGEANDQMDKDGGADENEDGGADEDGQTKTKGYRKGQLTDAQRKEIQALGDEFRAKIAALESKFNKSRSHLMRVAGFEIRPSRARNPYNDFQEWYAIVFSEENEGLGAVERKKKTRRAYLDLMHGLGENDHEEKDRRMEHIREDVERFRSEAKDSDEVKSFASTRVRGAIKQFTELAQSYCTLDDMVIGGFVVHLGTNRHAKRLSGWWGGSDLFKQAIGMYEPDLDEMMDIMMTVFKSLKYSEKGIKIPTPQTQRKKNDDIEKVPGPVTTRDGFRYTFGDDMRTQLNKFTSTYKTFKWKRWLEVALELKLRITNWPFSGRFAPGYGFSAKAITQAQHKILSQSGVKIVQWTNEELRLDEEDLADVPLVTGVDGVILRQVGNCKTWSGHKEYQRRLQERIDAMKAAEGGDSDVAPSEKSHSKAQSGHKRKALDDEVDSSDIEEIAAPVPVKKAKKTKKPRVRSPSPLPSDPESIQSHRTSSVHDRNDYRSSPPSESLDNANALAKLLSHLPQDLLNQYLRQSQGQQTRREQPQAGPSRLRGALEDSRERGSKKHRSSRR